MNWSAIFFFLVVLSLSQEAKSNDYGEEEEDHSSHWKLGLVMGHTWLPAGDLELTGQKALIVPSWGLDLGYQFNHKIGLALANEITVQRYVISHDGENLVRDNPFILALELMVHLGKGFSFLFGPGIELEKHENFFIMRAGIEYELSLGTDWFFFPSAFYESKQGKFGAFTIGFGIGRQFHKK